MLKTKPFKAIQDFLHLEAASGIILLAILVVILGVANSPLYDAYHHLVEYPIPFTLWGVGFTQPLEEWVNEGLMPLFFMLLALEMKREVLVGELSSVTKITLPFATAAGGIAVPVLVFLALAPHNAAALRGWAIPTTTDIALVLAFMTLMGRLIPPSLKIWMIALSIVDDIVAIALIAVFYASNLSYLSLALAVLGVLILWLMNRCKVQRLSPYLIIGAGIWLAVLYSGVHATLAGTIVGFFIPFENKKTGRSPLRDLEHRLHVWVAYLILPLFIVVNAGIRFVGIPLQETFSALPIAVACGLFLGKQLGIFSFGFVLIKLKWAQLPKQATWLQFYGVSVLAGVGFTMSVFISTLAYQDTPFEMVSKQGILLGSLCSAVLGIVILSIAHWRKQGVSRAT